jgi:hypothetical protein
MERRSFIRTASIGSAALLASMYGQALPTGDPNKEFNNGIFFHGEKVSLLRAIQK